MDARSRNITISALSIGSLWAAISSGQSLTPRGPGFYRFSNALPERDIIRLSSLRAAALGGDHSQVPEMRAALQEKHPAAIATALHALKSLDTTEALPDIDNVARQAPIQQLRNEAAAARARIVADAASRGVSLPADRAALRIRRFLSEVGLSSAVINLQTAAYKLGAGQDAPLGLFALWEIADMAYRDSSVAYLHLPDMQGIDFSRDPGAAIKIRLAAMPLGTRIPWMVDTLAAKKVLRTEDSYLMQLAADEGPAFSRAAAAKLMEMEHHRAQYSRAGFTALFRAMGGTGDKTQAPVIKHFLTDRSDRGWIANYARQVYPYVYLGYRRQLAPGY